MSDTKRCFIAMPIKREGTPEHAHFKALCDQVLRPVIAAKGYEVTRADEITKAGAITRDIVLSLADADLVVVDLTDLNPNVFYELGVRHSLRAKGTVMIVDTSRTDSIPFDLGAYRVIQFKGELTGVGKLADELGAFLDKLNADDPLHERDNPVHDWMPSLPSNALASAAGSIEGPLRDQLKKANDLLHEYEQAYGKVGSRADRTDRNPLTVVLNLLAEAEQGNLPADLFKQAKQAGKDLEVKPFLSAVRRIIETGARLADVQFHELGAYANNLDLPDVVEAIFDHALQIHPKSKDLRRGRLTNLVHSSDPAVRERARHELLNEIGVTIDDTGNVHATGHFGADTAPFLGLVLDAYHAGDLNDQALTITQFMVGQFPNLSVIVRNHARALEHAGRPSEALDFYRKAIWCPDATDISAVWLGNELHNQRRHVDAIEAYLLGCLLDPEDATNFAHVADDLTLALHREMGLEKARTQRKLPANIGVPTVQDALVAALSCDLIDKGDVERCTRVAARAELDISAITQTRMSRRDRIEFAASLYEKFQSELTTPPRDLQ